MHYVPLPLDSIIDRIISYVLQLHVFDSLLPSTHLLQVFIRAQSCKTLIPFNPADVLVLVECNDLTAKTLLGGLSA
jgi:hypothetical protein